MAQNTLFLEPQTQSISLKRVMISSFRKPAARLKEAPRAQRNKNNEIHPVISKQKIIFGYPDMLEQKFQKISLFYNDIVSPKGWKTYKTNGFLI